MEDRVRDRIADWVAALGRRQLIALAIGGVALLAGAGLWYVRSLPRPVEIAAQPARASPTPSPALLVVHVAGWVVHPGVYELHQGERVIDAIELAGGARKGADLSALNLAALLQDAQQVLVPRAAPSGGAAGAAGAAPGAPGALMNLNVATAEQLETLPGIGPVLAQAILDYRTEHGPFASVEDLLNVRGIGEARLEDLRDAVTV